MNRERIDGERERGYGERNRRQGRERGEIGIWVECRHGKGERGDRKM